MSRRLASPPAPKFSKQGLWSRFQDCKVKGCPTSLQDQELRDAKGLANITRDGNKARIDCKKDVCETEFAETLGVF